MTKLVFEHGPPAHIPYRFFATAPWFGIAAGVLLALVGADGFGSRWTPAALAFTHLFTLGFMLQVMCGALLQIIPVATGEQVDGVVRVATVSHLLLTAGVPLLVAGFLVPGDALRIAAATLIVLGLAVFLQAILRALFRARARGPSLFSLRTAALALLVTAALGTALVAELGGHLGGNTLLHTDIHAAFGLAGWTLSLLIGVGYLVVPMFQLTPNYPAALARGFPWLVVASLGLLVLHFVAGALTLLAIVSAGFALTTWHLQRRRKRHTSDTSLDFWRVAQTFLLVCAGLLLLLGYDAGIHTQLELALGVAAMIGVAVSAINGMLYRIVPFLNWMQLQRAGGFALSRVWISNRRMRLQWWSHLGACLLLLVAVVLPQAVRPAGIALAASQLWLGANLWSAMRALHRACATQTAEAAPVA